MLKIEKICQSASNTAACPRTPENGSKCLQTHANAHKHLQMPTNAHKNVYAVNNCKCLQRLTRFYTTQKQKLAEAS